MSQKSEQKQKSHEAILASAATLLLERGIRASSVMDVMKGAGLTVGGFYGHFDSKEHLFTETIRATARTLWNRLLHRATAEGGPSRSPALIVLERYLSREHRDRADSGCPLPSIAPEVAREGEPYRGALEGELAEFLRSFSALLGPGEKSRRKALGVFALMYGALSLSRAVRGTRLSDEFLEAAQELGTAALTQEPPPPPRA
ncbi:TetR/AcrR family transcriptional regulator [Melittangium boletus]|uniref:TetR family transcriptional regulator n=1 Tax=Melittangium boletus DSM 14713 TaxID=1294270 RepID=A0A250ID15_9BACT|nr:TetR/AcrR family transcriptional regulator [Melittangium boletus]ATB29739.1 TetR family transcriptional regulator [Melittangium boletus DSM 14713]